MSGQASKPTRPALHHRPTSDQAPKPKTAHAKATLPRNQSAKSVRIVEDVVTGKRPSHARQPSTASTVMSRSGSTDTHLSRVRSRESTAGMAKEARRQPMPMAMAKPKASGSNVDLTSLEPRSVIRGFETGMSMSSAASPGPNVSPADRSPPRVALACRPATHLPPISASASEDSNSSVAQSLIMPPAPPPTPFGSVLPSKGVLGARPPVAKPQHLSPILTEDAEAGPSNGRKSANGQRRGMFFLSQSIGSDSDSDSVLVQSMQAANQLNKLSPQRSRTDEESNKPFKPSSLGKSNFVLPSEAEDEEEDEDDSSGWGSDYSSTSDAEDGSVAVRRKGKGKAKDPPSQPEGLFQKRVPTAPGPLNRVESRGLLTQLFRPSAEEEQAVAGLLRNPSAVGLVLAARSKSSADALPARRGLQPSKSAIALPVMSFDADKGTFFPHRGAPVQSGPAQPIPAKTRLGGRPADVDFSDDDSTDEERDSSLPGLALSPGKAAALAAAVSRHKTRYIENPRTPRTTRRVMLSTELSESLRRNLLWERQSRNRLMGNAAAGRAQPPPPALPPMNGHQAGQTAPANLRTQSAVDLTRRSRSSAGDPQPFSGGLHEQ
jgi:hypothetical protein